MPGLHDETLAAVPGAPGSFDETPGGREETLEWPEETLE
jgi:hypothetical protein